MLLHSIAPGYPTPTSMHRLAHAHNVQSRYLYSTQPHLSALRTATRSSICARLGTALTRDNINNEVEPGTHSLLYCASQPNSRPFYCGLWLVDTLGRYARNRRSINEVVQQQQRVYKDVLYLQRSDAAAAAVAAAALLHCHLVLRNICRSPSLIHT